MNHRERANAILHYEKYDRMPLVAFCFWGETVDKWADEGHITREMAESCKHFGDNSPGDRQIMDKLGFDFNWFNTVGGNSFLRPWFKSEVLSVEEDGSQIIRDGAGLIQRRKPGVNSIPAEIGTSMTGREA